MGAESFTVLAILEARDRASEIFAKVDESLDRFSETAKGAADSATAAGDKIDESLFKTTQGANALEVTSARVAAAQEQAARTAEEQALAQRELIDAQRAAAVAADDDIAAQDRLVAAGQRLNAVARENAVSQKALADAQRSAAAADTEAIAAASAQADAQKKAAGESAAARDALGGIGKVMGLTALGMGIAGALMVKAAGNFQDSTTHLVTDAGESAKNLGMVQAGILKVSTATGQSASDITNAMYHVESSGFHAASGLAILKTAAEGARVGGADLDTTSKALVGTMTAYYGANLSAGQATKDSTSLMNQLVATVGSGDMRMQDLASSLSSVAPVAARAGLSFAQIGGAIATMTAQGMTAQNATQELSHTITSLQNPTNVQVNEMQQLGLNAQQVAKNLGRKGLTGTIGELSAAITSHMGKSGLVIQSAFNNATNAAKDANTEIAAMPANLQTLAKGFLSGSINAKDWRNDLYGLSPVQANLMKQFAATAEKAHSFNSLLASGSPAAQTYTAALAKMTGGQVGLKTALMLTGANAATFNKNVRTISDAAKHASGDVEGWSTIQGTFNFKLSQAKTAVENTGISIGTALLPAVTSLLSAVSRILVPIAEWTANHKKLTEILFAGVTALTATIAILIGTVKAFKAVKSAVEDVGKAVRGTIGMLQKLAGKSKETAEAEEASSGEAAAAQEADAAEVAVANDEAAAESSGSWATAAAAQITSAAKWVAQSAVKVATVTAQYATAAASTALSWAKSAVTMLAQAAVWVATSVAKVAIVVAANVAGALATAAAWVVANAAMLLGITLVVAAVAAAVYLIVSHWSDIVHGVEVAWNAVYSFISKIIRDVISFVKSHWVLIIELITGPLGIAVVQIIKHWNTIERWFKDGVKAVERAVSWFAGLPGMFGRWIAATASAVWREGARFLSWYSTLEGKILKWLSGLPGKMLNVGENIVKGIWNGISNTAGWLAGKIGGFASSILGDIGSAFGLGSPSKYTTYHGKMLGAGLANGILASIPQVLAAAHRMAGSVLSATSGLSATGSHGIGSALAASAASQAGAGSTGGGTTIVIDVHDNHIMSNSDIDLLVGKIGKRLATQILPAAGRKYNIR